MEFKMNNLAHEYAQCSAYYALAAESLDIENLPERKGAYDKLIQASKAALFLLILTYR